ncbi:class I SAM-dependent methyltransferase [Gracilimonas mengyeensis]|uniref:2-polyprenyl-3-methyl-5-hydroxy-6-metoxy-1,4-benzoquinol methylase n=1 Tax=Gracilimonas mengyeensis TaxID=1302730 RepID=A0A521FIR7_9BACT|nr:class I SAM-dependent methyltransferase [Gracilimonas mengyeensis]SMO96103.1 2-polyprenyl-3-methyl-5-hydroxy-6-metoxy-1,4-benzoquinol methylase [Gracilimonas mengyeensis]
MPRLFAERQPHLVEHMDREDCDPQRLENTYRQFSLINRLLARWKKVYQSEIRPLMQQNQPYTMLDIGFGGGDLPVRMQQWARQDGIDLFVTAIDPDPRAFRFVQKNRPKAPVQWQQTSSSALAEKGQSFDFVISNHLLHHLTDSQAVDMMQETSALARKKVIFNDIERSAIGYGLFNVFSRPLFRKSFITEDGLTSIKRSFTRDELRRVVPNGWQVKPLFPFRLLAVYEPEN